MASLLKKFKKPANVEDVEMQTFPAARSSPHRPPSASAESQNFTRAVLAAFEVPSSSSGERMISRPIRDTAAESAVLREPIPSPKVSPEKLIKFIKSELQERQYLPDDRRVDNIRFNEGIAAGSMPLKEPLPSPKESPEKFIRYTKSEVQERRSLSEERRIARFSEDVPIQSTSFARSLPSPVRTPEKLINHNEAAIQDRRSIPLDRKVYLELAGQIATEEPPQFPLPVANILPPTIHNPLPWYRRRRFGIEIRAGWSNFGFCCKALAFFAFVLLVNGGLMYYLKELNNPKEIIPDREDGLTLSNMNNGKFKPNLFIGHWTSDDKLVFKDENDDIILMNANGTLKMKMVDSRAVNVRNLSTVSLSANKRFLLMGYEQEKIFKYSVYMRYMVYKFSTTREYFMYAEWSTTGNALAIVIDNDIYYSMNGTMADASPITNTGKKGEIYNGITDYTYEVEILKTNKALWFSPDGRYLMYGTFNNTLVSKHAYDLYDNNGNYQHSKMKTVTYPMAGGRNPDVTFHIVDLKNVTNLKYSVLTEPIEFENGKDYYIVAATWVTSIEVSLIWMDRAQTKAYLTICRYPLWLCLEVIRLTVNANGWIDNPGPPLYSRDTNSIIIAAPFDDKSHGIFKHILFTNVSSLKPIPLTRGRLTVDRIIAWDHDRNRIYFMGIPADKPSQLHLYFVYVKFYEPEPQIYCVTCNGIISQIDAVIAGESPTDVVKTYNSSMQLVSNTNDTCTYHNAIFSRHMDYFVLECLGPIIPTVSVHGVNNNEEFQLMEFIIKNDDLRKKVSKMMKPLIRSHHVELYTNFTASIKLYFPPEFREHTDGIRYPLVIQVYNGPHEQLINSRWQLELPDYLAVKEHVIVALVDGRGSPGHGYSQQYQIYQKLGLTEVNDLKAVLEYLTQHYTFIDKMRVLVFGWRYGGSLSFRSLLTEEESPFKCAIGISPIVDWRIYNSAYAERYLGKPNDIDNVKYYDEADLTKHVKYIANGTRRILLVYNTGDVNVHVEHNMLLANALKEAGVNFSQQIYHKAKYDFSDVKINLYEGMIAFMKNCFSYAEEEHEY